MVDGTAVRRRRHRERSIELPRESPPVVLRKDRITVGPQHVGRDTGTRHGLAGRFPATRESPPRRIHELAGMRDPGAGEGGCGPRCRQAEQPDRVAHRLVGQAPLTGARQGVGEHQLHNAAGKARGEAELDATPEGMAEQRHLVELQAVESGGEGVEHRRVAPTTAHVEEVGDDHPAAPGQQVGQAPVGGRPHGVPVEQHHRRSLSPVDGHGELVHGARVKQNAMSRVVLMARYDPTGTSQGLDRLDGRELLAHPRGVRAPQVAPKAGNLSGPHRL